jgi:hypothetical protein
LRDGFILADAMAALHGLISMGLQLKLFYGQAQRICSP